MRRAKPRRPGAGGAGAQLRRLQVPLLLLASFTLPFVFLNTLSGSLPSLKSASRVRVRRHRGSGGGGAPGGEGAGGGGDGEGDGAEFLVSLDGAPAQAYVPQVVDNPKCRDPACPVLFSVEPASGSPGGGTELTITGKNLGDAATLKEIMVGGLPCAAVASVSPEVATCRTPPGIGRGLSLRVTVGVLAAYSQDETTLWSYASPVIHRIEPNHAPNKGGSTLLIRGANFGAKDSYPKVAVGNANCQDTAWVSDELIRCVVPPGSGIYLTVEVTVCGCGEFAKNPQTAVARKALSYDEDLMRTKTKAILSKVSLRPAGIPLLLTRDALGSDFELQFVDVITREKQYYAITPELLQALPKRKVEFRHETCALVGNSGNLLDSGFGAAIDEHDAVFRFHNAKTIEYQADVGSKTTYMTLDATALDLLVNQGEEHALEETDWWSQEATLLLWSMFSQEAYVRLREEYPQLSVYFLSPSFAAFVASTAGVLKERIERALRAEFRTFKGFSSVLYTMLFAARVCGDVTVYGVDMRSGRYRYFDKHDPGQAERDAASLEYLLYLVLQAAGVIGRLHEPSTTLDAAPKDTACEARECVLDCSHRGAFRNGTCHCDPIYGGADCGVNLMLQKMDRIFKDVNLTYGGHLTMNQQEVEGTVINLPKGISRGKLKEVDVYKVDRALYHALPAEDIQERYSTCAIVGNSGHLLDAEHGKAIDAHEVVYRFNQAPTKGFEPHAGGFSSHESLNGYWMKQLLDERRGFKWNWRQRNTALVVFEMYEPSSFGWKTKTQIYEKDQWWKQSYLKLRKLHADRKLVVMSPNFVSWCYLRYREIRRSFHRNRLGRYPGEKPMSGFYAFLFALQVCDEVDIYGFAPWHDGDDQRAGGANKYHYFDGAIPRPGSHSFDLALYIYELFAARYDNVRVW